MAHDDDFAELAARALALLGRGTVDRRSKLRWFTLATVSPEGLPQARTVVLRTVDRTARTLTLYSDARATKMADITAQPRVMCHFFDSDAMVQMRWSGQAIVHHEGAVWQRHWQGLTDRGKRDYASLAAPGAAEPDTAYDASMAEVYFRAIEVQLQALDWLSLSRDGHRRARLQWSDDGDVTGDWVVP
ncbi:MAG: pyridoxamine 5'-phosphate oxidase family protein [Pseudomonadota bacterium]